MKKVIGVVNSAAKGMFISEHFLSCNMPVVFILNDEEEMEEVYEDITGLFPGTNEFELIVFPETDTNRRTVCLHKLKSGNRYIILTTLPAIEKPVISQSELKTVTVTRTGKMEIHEIVSFLTDNGYSRVNFVEEEGQVAVRGEIVDVWTPQMKYPVRIVFDNDIIETIKTFDIETQKSVDKIESCELISVMNVIDGSVPGSAMPDFFSYIKQCSIVADSNAEYGNCDIKLDLLEGIDQGYRYNTRYHGDCRLFISEYRKLAHDNVRIKIFCDTDGEKNRVIELLEENSIDNLPEIIISRLNTGFINKSRNLCIITYNEIFSSTGKSVKFPKFKKGKYLEGLWEITPGDYVVHEKYGIGNYLGLTKVAITGVDSEFIYLEYAGNDKLYVPITDFHKVQKFIGVEGRKPKLSSLDTPAWERAKERAKKSAEDMAKQLYEIYMQRKSVNRERFHINTEYEKILSDTFPYEETPDQLRVIDQVNKDMESGNPMDRLVLGDVGYGKTEVAVRAAMKCVQSSKQAVLLCPTTVLAEQHYKTFIERLSSFPVNIALLCRFKTKVEQKKIVSELKKGVVDIVIGTHRLLSKDIIVKKLGLIIIDDEHKFGVKHKEKIKLMKMQGKEKSYIDTLSLTATPIPRTISMTMSGLKDISLIETPPEGRISIETYIGVYNNELISRAVSSELARNGQVFYVFNHVKTIQSKMNQLQLLIPNARFAYAHGQMEPKEIERIMWDFMNNKIDCLVSTTIIEAGIDIPNVNTMIIEQAEELGLAQLYQLRGRVGRGQKKAYCYLFYSDVNMTEDAKRRLEAIHEFTELGSGFKLALRDMEIRGAGEVLGIRQHGFIQEVGLNLYNNYLSEQVDIFRNQPAKEKEFVPSVELNISAYIPQEIIESEDIRILYYRKFMAVETEPELSGLIEEFKDKFGKLREPVLNLVSIIQLRILMNKLKIPVIREKERFIELLFSEMNLPEEVVHYIAVNYWDKIEFGNDESGKQVIKIVKSADLLYHIEFIKKFLDIIVKLINK